MPATVVPTLDNNLVAVPNTTDGLLDGVEKGKYRFVGVKRGTVLVSGDGIRINRPGQKDRLTFEVETPEGIKSALVVMAVTPEPEPSLLGKAGARWAPPE